MGRNSLLADDEFQLETPAKMTSAGCLGTDSGVPPLPKRVVAADHTQSAIANASHELDNAGASEDLTRGFARSA